MSRVGLLLAYKLKSFFAPSYRGKYGPLPLIGLVLLFIPSGISLGYTMGDVLAGDDPSFGINLLGSMLSVMMVFGFVFSLGVGVTAQPSELDFVMTTPVKPREYLVADLMFQFGSVTIAGGMAILFTVFGFLWGAGEPILLAVPVLLLAGVYFVMVFFIIQILTVTRIRYPRSRVRSITLLLLALSLVPMASFASSDFPVSFSDLPIPQTAFAGMIYAVMTNSAVEIVDVIVGCCYLAFVGAIWAKASGLYFFHGVKPTLSAGFGQVDMGSKMAQQKRMIEGFGRFTTTITLRSDTGGELSFMTRLNLIRFWRDGSFIFIALLVGIFLGTGLIQLGSDEPGSIAINLFQASAWPIAVLALNWCYYERENLWIAVVGGRSLVSYFRGLMMAMVAIGLGVAAVILVIILLSSASLSAEEVALVISTPIADAAIATALLTRVRVKPGAFSAGAVAILAGTIMLGAGISGAMWLIVGAIGDSTALMVSVQLIVAIGLSIGMCFLGLTAVTRLARGFRFA